MDKETAERLTKLETKLEIVERHQESWNTLIKDTVLKVVKLLIGVGFTGLMFGWHLPENFRKAIAEWISK